MDAWIVDAVRTPRGRGRADGALHGIHPQELFAQCLQALCARTAFDPADVDDVIAGNGILAGEHGDDIARLSVLLAGWPDTVP
ncbi:acetyl-CoA C-acyltransferase, partial [Mycolicibacterium elephantis]